jgi:ribosomal protein S18 acetylase RimI-like enzyme
MSVSLRPATAQDVEFLWALHRDTLAAYVDAIWGWVEPEQRGRFHQEFKPAHRQIVELEGRPIGLWHVEWHPDHVFLASVEILPSYQNRGIGSRLVRELLHRAREQGLPVRLQVLLGNPAERLYKRLGFRETSRSSSHVHLVCPVRSAD